MLNVSGRGPMTRNEALIDTSSCLLLYVFDGVNIMSNVNFLLVNGLLLITNNVLFIHFYSDALSLPLNVCCKTSIYIHVSIIS